MIQTFSRIFDAFLTQLPRQFIINFPFVERPARTCTVTVRPSQTTCATSSNLSAAKRGWIYNLTPILVCGAIVERYVRMERRERLCQRRTESTSPFGESHLRAGGAFLPLRVARESRLKPHDFAVFGKGRRIKCVFVPYLAFPRAPRRLLETKLSLAAYRVHRTLLRHTAVLPGLFRHPTSSEALRALTTRRRRTTNWGFLSAGRSAATSSVRVRRTLPQRRCEPEWLNSCGGSLPTWR